MNYRNYRVREVDGAKLRKIKTFCDFLDFGVAPFFKTIPKNEIWVAAELDPIDKVSGLAAGAAVLDALAAGKSEDEAVDAGEKKSRWVRSRSGQQVGKASTEDVRVMQIAREGDLTVLLVDGSKVRNMDPNFIEGGHGYVYSYVPKNEVWIDNTLEPSEWPKVIKHEVVELKLMRNGMSYDKAHVVATNAEYSQYSGKRKEPVTQPFS